MNVMEYKDLSDEDKELINDKYDTIKPDLIDNALNVKVSGKYILKDEAYQKFSEIENVITEIKNDSSCFRFFNFTVEGEVTLKLVVDEEIIYEKSFTDTSVQLALPDSVTKFEQIVIEGDGKVTSCECPIIVDCTQPWERGCGVWKNTTFDFSTSAARSGITNKGGVKILNINGWYTSISPIPSVITFGDIAGDWSGIAYSTGFEDNSWAFWGNFSQELNRIHDKTSLTPMFWWNNSDSLGFTDPAVGAMPGSAIKLDKNGLPYITSTNFGPFKKLGWFDAEDCNELNISLPTLEVLLLGNLGCNLNISKAHLDDVSINHLGNFAKNVTNKTITFSGYNFYRLSESQKKLFTDKGFNIAVNWDNDEVYKFMYDLEKSSEAATLNMSIENEEIIYTASKGMWYTESDEDIKGRTFANSIITKDINNWKLVSNSYKEEYETEQRNKLQKEFDEMTNGYKH